MDGMNNGSYLEFQSISKRFPGVLALDRVSFAVQQGEIRALIGENGAGKSTLLKTLSGVYPPNQGNIVIDGRRWVFRDPLAAIQAGVSIIYQELHLVPEISVAENLFLGRLPSRWGLLDKQALKEQCRWILNNLHEDIDPSAKLGTLALAQRQMVEIAKALARQARIIAFDEPTSSLSKKEVDRLFDLIRGLKKQGKLIIYVSHRLPEIFEICDSVTVFKDGRLVESFSDINQVNPDTLIQKMVGRSLIGNYHFYKKRELQEPILQVREILGPGLSQPVSLRVKRGEVLGIFGLVGAGRTELLKLIYGAVKAQGGEVMIHGQRLRPPSPQQSIRKGMVFCPEDRKKEGIIPAGSVLENINLSVRRILARFGIIDEKRETANARHFIRMLSIKTPSLKQLMLNLSGGNQQKTILARWLSEKIKVILFDEPTRGIDVGAKSEIYKIIAGLAADGIGVIVVSSELPEVMGITDRILIMRQGAISAEFTRRQATEEELLKNSLPLAQSNPKVRAAGLTGSAAD